MEFMVNRHTCVDEGGTAHTFTYFLLQDRLCRDGFVCEDYGVRICSDTGDNARVPHVTADRTRADELLGLLCRQGVSPIHLRDIIDDWL